MAPKAPKFELKTPKGTKDHYGRDVQIREQIFKTITDVFKRHGGTSLDTPVFELKEILAGKYGEDSKLIYDLADQGGEICALRYDLTVPFARWLAMNPDVSNTKRYCIAKVYRRDAPAMTKGRMREFYQCDFDIAGPTDPMLADAEILRITREIFDGLGWGNSYTIKLNHRKCLDGIFEVCGVPAEKLRTISSAVDKLDKLPWDEVRKEMVVDKELEEDVADRIGEFVVQKGGKELLEKLQKDDRLTANESMQKGLSDLALLFDYLESFDALDAISFDLSLARGLDYYTGLIYEVVTEGSAPEVTPGTEDPTVTSKKAKKKGGKTEDEDDRSNDPTVGVGSVAAGGRYDGLVSMFSPKNQMPCVGISFGVERIYAITKARLDKEAKAGGVRNNETDVYVMAFGGKGFTGLVKERMTVISKLWDAGIRAELLYKVKPKLQQQFKAAESNLVPFACILGEEEWNNGQVRVKEMGLPDGHPQKDGVLVKIEDLAQEVKHRLERKHALDDVTQQAEGLRVVHGVKGEDVDLAAAAEATANPEEPSSAP